MMTTECPWCGTPATDHAGQTPGQVPQDGDWSICIACLGVGIYLRSAGGLRVRRANRAELDVLLRDPALADVAEILMKRYPAEEAIEIWRSHGEAQAQAEAEDAERAVGDERREHGETDPEGVG